MRGAASILAGAFACVAVAATARAEPLKIKIGWIVPVEDMAPIAFQAPGVAKHLGKTYTIEPVHFQGTPQMITALAVHQVDIGDLVFSSIGLAIQNADMSDLRVLGNEFDDGVDDYATNQFRVAADSSIHSIKDLKGKVLATNQRGSAVDIAMRAMLQKAGLQESRDYTVVEAPFPAMKSMLAQGKVALAPSILPFSEDPELKKNSRVLFTAKQAMDGPSALAIWVAKDSYLKAHRAAIEDFLEDFIRATRWFEDPKNHDAAVQIAAKFIKAPPSRFQSWLFTKKDYYRNPDLTPDLRDLQANLDLQQKLGMLKERIDIAKYADLSYAKEAAARLNR